MKTETIAAIATSLSESGISIIRISGDQAQNVADKIVVTKNKTKVSTFKILLKYFLSKNKNL